MFFLRVSWLLKSRAGSKIERAEPSRAGRPVARAKSELSRAELNSVATLPFTYKRRTLTLSTCKFEIIYLVVLQPSSARLGSARI